MTNTFVQTWTKYLPIIRILLKRSVKDQQRLELNSIDFHRAAGGRKIKYAFAFSLNKGRLERTESATPFAKEFITALQNDELCNSFVKANNLELSMNNNFELFIRNIADSGKSLDEIAINENPAAEEIDGGPDKPDGV
jgi:hypothetical protein